MKRPPLRLAFTLLEVIAVIVILGIVASIGSSIIANTYENYLVQRAVYRASLKTELAAGQIANMLSYRIPYTTIAKNPANLNDWVAVSDASVITDNTHIILEWIGSEYDSFNGARVPGWSGFCDLNASSNTQLATPGSNLTFAGRVIGNTFATGGNVAIFFRHYLARFTPDIPYNPACMGLISNDTSCINRATVANATTLNFTDIAPNRVLSEHYKLAVSAFALWPQPNRWGNFDLVLYYNYRPWDGTRLNRDLPDKKTVIENITVFKFAEKANTFRFKLCAQEPIGTTDANITICKEKAVIL